jgi:hypothetical protein
MDNTAERIVTAREAVVSATYERTIVVPVPAARALGGVRRGRRAGSVDDAPGHDALTHPDTPVMDGFEPGEFRLEAVETHRHLAWSQRPAVIEGWYQVTVTFEEVASGTRITIVRSGFGDTEDWRHYAANTVRQTRRGVGTSSSPTWCYTWRPA